MTASRNIRAIFFTPIALLTFITVAATVASLIWLLTIGRPGRTVGPSAIAGTWTGILQTYYCPSINCRLANLRLFLHIAADSAGKLHASFDSVDQNAMDLPGAHAVINGNAFSFDVPSIQASYKATLSADGNSLKGTWIQYTLLPLDLTRVPTGVGVAGIWEGDYGSCPLRLVLHVTEDSKGKLEVVLDSVDDRDPMGAIGKNVVLDASAFSFEIPPSGNYRATLSADGYLKGTAHDADGTHPVIFTRTTAAAAPTPVPVLTRPRVTLDNLKPILDQELKPVLERGLLSKPTGGGLVIGVLDHGDRRIFSYGAARQDSIFEIGSITKTFTGLVLAQMVVQGKVSLNEPVRTLLPPGFAGKPGEREITLLDLATHHSGLPRDAGNLDPKDPANPYADYGVRHLREFLTQGGLAKPLHTKFLYSNIGFGLLGYALSQRAGASYSQLLETEITGPLRMRDTAVALSPALRTRLIQGYDASFNRTPAWDWDAVAGAGSLKSTASDMLTYLDANLHPEKYAAGSRSSPPLAMLPFAVAIDHPARTDGGPGVWQALAWGINLTNNTLNDGGETYGYESFARLNPHQDWAVIVLYNRGRIGPGFVDFVDRVTLNVSGLLGSGDPRPSLDFMCEADRRALANPGN